MGGFGRAGPPLGRNGEPELDFGAWSERLLDAAATARRTLGRDGDPSWTPGAWAEWLLDADTPGRRARRVRAARERHCRLPRRAGERNPLSQKPHLTRRRVSLLFPSFF